MSRRHPRRARFLGFLCAAVSLAAAPAALAAEPRATSLASTGPASTDGLGEHFVNELSADGSRLFFESSERLVAADADASVDLYERAGEAIRLLSIGPAGGNGTGEAWEARSSEDGSVVYFGSDEPLLAQDTDTEADVYVRAGGELHLVSVGDAGNGAGYVELNAISADGSKAYLGTEDALDPLDADTAWDVYEYDGTVARLITPGVAAGIELMGINPDGSTLVFRTAESLDPQDTDDALDLYVREGGDYELVSIGPEGGNDPAKAGFLESISVDGSRIFFQTDESLVAEDTDAGWDIYERRAGTTALVSYGPAGGNGPDWPGFGAISADGSRVFFQTTESLVAGDTDGALDVYERSGGVTTLVSGGDSSVAFGAVSADGSLVVVVTGSPLVAADTDAERDDVYRLGAGGPTLMSPGIETADVYLKATSSDLSRVVFATSASAVATDTDSSEDLYASEGGELTLLSLGATGGNANEGAEFAVASADARTVGFISDESLVAADADAEEDIYVSGPAGPPPPATPAPPSAPRGPAAKPRCAGVTATIVGTGKRDVLRGTNKRDVIFAGAGDDRVLGRGGNDLVCAGAGRDVVLGGAGNDRLLGQGGPDRIFGGAGRDAILGGGGRDLCRGQSGRPGPVRQCER